MEKNIIDGPSWCVIIHALIALDTIERLNALGQAALDSELNELHAAMDEDYKTFTHPNDEDSYPGHVNDEYIEVAITLPCLYWYSQLMIAHSFFERALEAVCMSLQKENGYILSLRDINGLGIARSKLYLKKVCNIQKPFSLSEWQSAKLFAEIRNAIAHRNGYVENTPDNRKSLYYRLNEIGVELNADLANQEDAQIILTRDLVLIAINAYRNLLKGIGDLGQDFITPKHGLPTSREKNKSAIDWD